MVEDPVREGNCAQLSEYLKAAEARGRDAAETGVVSTQVPVLADVPATKFAMAVATTAGTTVHVGDSDEPFSIQSLSKLFALCALLEYDPHAWSDIGWEPPMRAMGRWRTSSATAGVLAIHS